MPSIDLPYSTAERSTDDVEGKLAVTAIKDVPDKRIGLVGLGAMRFSFGAYLRCTLPGSELINASDLSISQKPSKAKKKLG